MHAYVPSAPQKRMPQQQNKHQRLFLDRRCTKNPGTVRCANLNVKVGAATRNSTDEDATASVDDPTLDGAHYKAKVIKSAEAIRDSITAM